MKPLFTANAVATGGRAGKVKAGSGAFQHTLSMPREMGGPGGSGTNPEELFAAGYAACFQSALQFMAGQKQQELEDCTVTSHVSIGEKSDGPGFALAVRMEVSTRGLGEDDAQSLVDAAHQVCPYSNAVRGNVDVAFSVDAQ